ncbi:ABC transporter substrate-binding protein [Nocardia sp. NPDC058666]|uniref:ABC transporter substrate-binding protein n=1 Tax=unclassified Nocardia TaxID=2637762 RepID=UPI003667BB50
MKAQLVIAAVILAATSVLSACSGSTESTAAYDGPIGSVNLREVCPAKIVVQSGWNPEAEFGYLYNLISKQPMVDAANKSTIGPLFAKGEYTGVDLEIRSGGPAIGFQPVSSRMYADRDIMLGFIDLEESVATADTAPTVSVFAPLEKNPQMIMWDPATYPQVKTIADLKAAKAKVMYFQGEAYMSYLVGAGILDKDQVDASYDGTPSFFVAEGGKAAQQGFASTEPYVYENQVPQWKKPVAYQLVADAGFPTYKSTLAVRGGDLAGYSACLKKLVPVIQQSMVDFLAAPDAANKVIVDSVAGFATGWTYDKNNADFAVKSMVSEGIVGNGPNPTVGDFDTARVQTIMDIATPIYKAEGVTIPAGLTPGKVATNEFIDPAIGLAKTP